MFDRSKYLHDDQVLAFCLLTSCFAAWGIAANMTDPLVKAFSSIFEMSAFQSSLVQFAYYGAYALLALPAAAINRRFSYKTGTMVGLGLAASGAILFFPASQAMTYWMFLLALFTLAGGLSILETSANPFVIAMGPAETGTRRLNFAQAFNPIGSNLGVLLAAVFILPELSTASSDERAAMSEAERLATRQEELQAMMAPYVGYALFLVLILIAVAVTRMPTRERDADVDLSDVSFGATIGRLARNHHYVFGVVAQFFNVAAQVCVWTYTIQYTQESLGIGADQAGWWLQASLIVFLIARFLNTWIMGYVSPSRLMLGLALVGSLLAGYAAFVPGLSGAIAVVSISACLSVMFPTIYGTALEGLGEDTKFGAAGLVMAIVGGALMPMVQGATLDAVGAALSFIVPGLCFLVVAAYSAFDLRTARTTSA